MRQAIPLGIHCGPKTICQCGNTSASHHHRSPLYMVVTTTRHCGSSHHHQNSSSLITVSLNLMRHPCHPSTIAVEPATIGIHSNFLPLTHLTMAHTQSMATTNTSGSSFPVLWSCLLHLGSIHLLRCIVIQHLVRGHLPYYRWEMHDVSFQ